jgi:signal transduction histidine kinase
MTSPTNAVADPALVRYARRISHDLNNFSTVVRTYSELLLAELPADSPARADIEEIQRAAEGMVAYLQRVTRFARAGLMRRAPLPIDASVLDAVALFRSEHTGREVRVDAQCGARIEADPQWLRDVLLELLSNAADASPGSSTIVVSTGMDGDAVLVSIRDEGDGVQGVSEGLFEPFSSSRQGVRGAGQGLALAMAFALAVQGSLTLGRDGSTTVATLRIPQAAAPMAPPPMADPSPAPAPAP